MMPQKTYLPVISSLRGLAATAICFYHFVWSTANYIEQEWVRSIFYYGQYGVPLFFVISGIVLPLSMFNNQYQFTDLNIFLTKRLLRLEPPYFISLLFGLAYLVFQAYRYNSPLGITANNFILHLGYLIPFVEGEKWINPVYWSLAVEFQYYLFLSVGFIALRHPNFMWRATIYTLMLSTCYLSDHKAMLFRWFPLFLIGILYVLQQQNVIKNKEYSLFSLLSLALVCDILGGVHAFMAILAIVVIHYRPNYNPSFMDWIGKRSYSLYLIHLIVGQAVVNALSHSYRLPYQKVIVLLGGYTVSLLAAWLLHRYVEKPSQSAAAKLVYPDKSTD